MVEFELCERPKRTPTWLTRQRRMNRWTITVCAEACMEYLIKADRARQCGRASNSHMMLRAASYVSDDAFAAAKSLAQAEQCALVDALPK